MANFSLSSLLANLSDGTKAMKVQQTGSIVEEQLTEEDAVDGVLTFGENISTVEIYNTDTTNTGVFNVNGIDISMPADSVFKASVGGTPSDTITITGDTTSYIVGRYV